MFQIERAIGIADHSGNESLIPPEKLAENWKRHASRLLLIARSIGEPAEDAVQEAFLQLARQPAVPDDPLAWLVAVTRNQILQWRRSGQRRNRRERSDRSPVWFESDSPQIDDSLDAQNLVQALQDLDDQRRQIIVMHLWGGMTFEAIAELLGLSRSTAHRGYQSGIREMRQRFDPESDTTQRVSSNEYHS